MIIDNRYYRIKSIFGYRLRALLFWQQCERRQHYHPAQNRVGHFGNNVAKMRPLSEKPTHTSQYSFPPTKQGCLEYSITRRLIKTKFVSRPFDLSTTSVQYTSATDQNLTHDVTSHIAWVKKSAAVKGELLTAPYLVPLYQAGRIIFAWDCDLNQMPIGTLEVSDCCQHIQY